MHAVLYYYVYVCCGVSVVLYYCVCVLWCVHVCVVVYVLSYITVCVCEYMLQVHGLDKAKLYMEAVTYFMRHGGAIEVCPSVVCTMREVDMCSYLVVVSEASTW